MPCPWKMVLYWYFFLVLHLSLVRLGLTDSFVFFRTFRRRSTTPTAWPWCPGLTSSSWKDTTGATTGKGLGYCSYRLTSLLNLHVSTERLLSQPSLGKVSQVPKLHSDRMGRSMLQTKTLVTLSLVKLRSSILMWVCWCLASLKIPRLSYGCSSVLFVPILCS